MDVWEQFRSSHPASRQPLNNGAPLREMFPGLPERVIEVLCDLGTGALGFADHRVFTLAEARERHASAQAQLTREREEVVEFDYAQCHGQGHETAQDCLAALSRLEPVVSGLYPLVGPDDVFDFVYVAVGGPWHGRVGTWYHDYPVCELFEEPPQHADLDAFGAHLLAIAQDSDARLL